MAEFVLTTPDGVRYKVTAETEQQAYSALQKMLGGTIPQAEEKPGIVERAKNWLTGANREENIGGPLSIELPMTSSQSAQMTALLATTMSPDRLKSGIQKIEPDVQFREDSFGNLVALWPRKDEKGKVTGYQQFYPNPAGLDTSDVMRASGAVAAATPVGRALRAIGLPTAGLTGAATIGATEAALVEGASSALSDAPYQYSDILYGAGGGVAGDALARTVQSLVAAARSVGPQSVIDASGNLLPKYADLVRKAGLDPDQVSAAVVADITNLARAGADPSQAAVAAMSRGLPTPVPMTQGQLTGSGRQQLLEDTLSKGGFGELAAAPIVAQRARQQAALTQNLDQILESLRPGAAPITRGEGGTMAQASLRGSREQAAEEADRLYNIARGTSAQVDLDAALSVADAMRDVYRQKFNPRTAPTVAALLDDFDAVASTGDIRSMMQWREQVSSLQRGAPTVDAAASKRVLDQFDAKIEEAINSAMMSGDADAVAKWGQAISNYADFASKWKSEGGILNILTEKATRDGERVLRVAPEQAADVVFSATASGLASKTGLPRDLLTLQRNLPKEQWDAMRQEAFIRLMDTSRGGMRGGETQVSGVNFKKAWENLREKNPGVVNGLFTKEEQNLIQQFADVSARATNTLANTSNTAAAASGLIQTIASSLGGKGPVQFAMRLPIANALRNAYGGTLAAMAASGRVPAGATPLTTGAAGAGAAAANTEEGRRQINAIPPVVGGVYNRLMGLLGE